MNLKGRLVHSLGGEKLIIIEQAAITAERIALEWNQDGQTGHLLAKSPNGSHFKGRYGYRNGKSDFECDLTLYKGAFEDLLYGTWRDPGAGTIGTLVVRLPSRSVETRAPAESLDLPAGESTLPAQSGRPAVAKPAPSVPANKGGASRVTPAAIPSTSTPPSPPMATPTPTPTPMLTATSAPSPTRTPAPSEPPAAAPVDAAHFDYLLTITAEQFDERGGMEIERELATAPLPALFKLSHNALADALRAIAARLFAERYGVLPASEAPAPPARPTESPESRTQKRRSSRHKQRRS